LECWPFRMAGIAPEWPGDGDVKISGGGLILDVLSQPQFLVGGSVSPGAVDQRGKRVVERDGNPSRGPPQIIPGRLYSQGF